MMVMTMWFIIFMFLIYLVIQLQRLFTKPVQPEPSSLREIAQNSTVYFIEECNTDHNRRIGLNSASENAGGCDEMKEKDGLPSYEEVTSQYSRKPTPTVTAIGIENNHQV